MKTTKIKVYQEFVKTGGTDVGGIAAKNNISRQAVYHLVQSVRKGSAAKFQVCEIDILLECLWKSKYETWWKAIPKSVRVVNEYVQAETRDLIQAMQKDKFTTAEIARRLGKDHATIRNLIKKKSVK